MPQRRANAAALGGSSDDIEAAFYDALQRSDIEQVMQCWSDEEEVFCVHPGGPRLLGVAAIRAAYESMFAQGTIRTRLTRVRRVESIASAVHNVTEHLEIKVGEETHYAVIVATNVYHKLPEGWRLVAHHASHSDDAQEQEEPAPSQVLH